MFDSSSDWDFLFGKRLMTTFAAVHDYAIDEVFIPACQLTLRNQYNIAATQRQGPHHKIQPQHEERKREDEEGDKAQSPLRGVPLDQSAADIWVIDTHIASAPSMEAETEAQPAVAGHPHEERETEVGDRMTSPLREVPTTADTETKSTADKPTSPRTSIEEVDDEESWVYKAKMLEEEKRKAEKEQAKKQQCIDEEQRQHARKQAKERARKMWTSWKGPSQRRHCRWKTWSTAIIRAK